MERYVESPADLVAAVTALRGEPRVAVDTEAASFHRYRDRIYLLQLAAPGVPDVYQGSELWEQSLVDPDNRRPIDLDLRAHLWKSVRHGEPTPLTSAVDDPGIAKLHVVHMALSPP